MTRNPDLVGARWPVVRLTLCVVAVTSSFLPWGKTAAQLGMHLPAGTILTSNRGDVLRVVGQGVRIDSDLKGFVYEANAWTSEVRVGPIRLPNWTVPIIVALVAVLLLSGVARSWHATICPFLFLLAAGQAGLVLFKQATGDASTIGFGLIAAFLSIAVACFAQFRAAEELDSPVPGGGAVPDPP